jgi:hypothetical protein
VLRPKVTRALRTTEASNGLQNKSYIIIIIHIGDRFDCV